jgi:mandelamide amidase
LTILRNRVSSRFFPGRIPFLEGARMTSDRERRESPGLADLSATAAVAAMRNGDMKAEDYARALVDRAEGLAQLNAFRTLDRETVLEAARAADIVRASGAALGLLHGLPVPVKDSVNTASLATSNGTRALRDVTPKTDAGVLAPLLAQGAIVMGKTSLHELSLGWTSNNLSFGAVHNPYDVTCAPGGSSGGSAVAVAARMAPLAIAEDTLGSIRIPATMCGVAGFRPSYGRYPNDGIMPLTRDKFDQVGPLARSVEDLALFDSVITGDSAVVAPIDLDGVKIGIPDSFMSALDPEVERVVTAAFERLRAAGAILVRAEVPDIVQQALPAALTILSYEAVGAISDFLAAQDIGVTFDQLLEQAGADTQAMMTAMAFPPARPSDAVYEFMLRQREQIRDAVREHFSRHGISMLAFPPSMILPPTIGDDGPEVSIGGRMLPRVVAMGRNVSLGSCASLASLVLPAGLSAGGLPVGIEFDALPGTDRRLLGLGLSLERALGTIAEPNI